VDDLFQKRVVVFCCGRAGCVVLGFRRRSSGGSAVVYCLSGWRAPILPDIGGSCDTHGAQLFDT
jgi:hypothetical protein